MTVSLSFVVFLIFAGSAAEAAGDAAAAADGGPEKVIFAIADVWPWAYEDEQGTLQGSLANVADRLSELSGVPVESRIRPVRRAVNELQSGDAHFSILFQSPNQDRDAINIAPMVRFNIMLTALADTTYPLSLEALAGKRVAFIRGTYLGDAFERNDSVQKVPINHVSQAMELLVRGRVSALLTSDHALYRTAEAMGVPPDLLRSEKHVPGQLGTLYMSRKLQRPDVAEKFCAAITQMSASGELKDIFFGKAGRPEYDSVGPNSLESPTE
jgi:ABC-type amino acid transport substrate-binding protein